MFNFKKITRIAMLAIAAPLTAGFLAAAPTPAEAIGFQNCSGVDLRIHVYNGRDVVQAIAQVGGRIDAGQLKIWKRVKRGKKSIKVFQANDGGFDKLIFSQSNLKHNWDYRVQVSGDGNWKVVPAGHPVPACPK